MTRLGELEQLVTAIDRALEREMEQRPATTDELKELFGDGFSEEYQAEAQERWGETDAWKQSARRTKSYTKADFERIKAESDAVNAAFVAALRSGAPATSTAAMDAAEAHRAHIERWFYDLDHGFHRGLADMYVADPRFTKTYEDLAPGPGAVRARRDPRQRRPAPAGLNEGPLGRGREHAAAHWADSIGERNGLRFRLLRPGLRLGCRQPRVLRGRALSSSATSARSSALWTDRSVPLGKYWRSSPLVFSLLPRCQGQAGSQK